MTPTMRAGIVLLFTAGSLSPGPTCDAAPQEAHERAVRAAGDALAEPLAHPWYDSGRDAFRPLNLAPPRQPAPPPQPIALDAWSSGMNALFESLRWLALIFVLGMILWLLLVAYRRRSAWLTGRRAPAKLQSQPLTTPRVDALPLDVSTLDGDLLAEARRRYAAGDDLAALVALFSHQLLELDMAHWIRLSRGKTNRQYLRELRRHDALATLFQSSMLAFEEAFYGHRPIDRGRFEQLWGQLDTFHALVRRGAT